MYEFTPAEAMLLLAEEDRFKIRKSRVDIPPLIINKINDFFLKNKPNQLLEQQLKRRTLKRNKIYEEMHKRYENIPFYDKNIDEADE